MHSIEKLALIFVERVKARWLSVMKQAELYVKRRGKSLPSDLVDKFYKYVTPASQSLLLF